LTKLLKVCKICGREKNIKRFITDTRFPTGRGSSCLPCYKKLDKAQRKDYWK
tara:strand:+ start:350 stop:505 length:156 start_codon:yes stop_codon:yes gene_type:complete